MRAWLLVSRCPSPTSVWIRCSCASHGRNWEGILVVLVVVIVAGVFVVSFFLRCFLPSEEAGYAGSRSRPPWVRIYCPQVVEGLISRLDILGGFGGLSLLSAETPVGRSARFLTEGAADHAARLVEHACHAEHSTQSVL